MQYVIAAVLAFVAGCQVTTWRFEAQISKAEAVAADAQVEEGRRVDLRQKTLQQEIVRLNDELEKKKRTLAADRDGIVAGTRVVHVAAKCPIQKSDASEGVGGTSRTTVGTARLEPAARADYLDYRRKYDEQLTTLRKCVAFAREVEQSRQ